MKVLSTKKPVGNPTGFFIKLRGYP